MTIMQSRHPAALAAALAAQQGRMPPPPVDGSSDEARARLWARLPSSHPGKAAALFALDRRQIHPDAVILRPVIISQRIPAAGAGANNLAFTFPTLTVIEAVRAAVGAGGATPFNYVLTVRTGTDGGFAVGTDTIPTALAAVDQGGLATQPIQLAPTIGQVNDPWAGVLTGDVGIAATQVVVAFYGWGMWTPNGQIQ